MPRSRSCTDILSLFFRYWRLYGSNNQPDPKIESPVDSTTNIRKPLPHIAIIGAGIGGLSFAIGCVKNDIPFILYESASQYSAVGAGVGLGPNALRALELIDPRLLSLYYEISSGNLTPNKDHVMFDALYAEEGFGEKRGWVPAPFGAACYDRTSAHRKDLLDILTSLIPTESVRFNKKAVSIKQDNYGVQITFEGGDSVEALAVVGCDGAKGPTRDFVLGRAYPEEVKATYSGKYVYRSIVPMTEALGILGDHAGDAKAFSGKGLTFITFPISRGTQYNMVAFKHSSEPWTHDQWTHMVSKEEMLADFDSTVDPRLLRCLEWAEPRRWSLNHHMKTSTYFNGRICLLGDSAHATTPHQAAGAGQCIEDALILSHILGKACNPDELPLVFQVYDAIRRPRAQKVVQTSQEAGEIYAFNNPTIGDNMVKLVENMNQRYLWIWEHDLHVDLERADQDLEELLRNKAKASAL